MVSNKLQNEEALGVDDAVTQPDIVKYTDTPEVQRTPLDSLHNQDIALSARRLKLRQSVHMDPKHG